MKIIPKKKQWENWSLINKLGYFASVITIVLFIIFILKIIFPPTNYSKLNYEVLSKFESYNVQEKELQDLHYLISQEKDEKVQSKTWDLYANSILDIYTEMNQNSTITINDTIFGKITNKYRHLDLSLTQKVAGQNILIAFKLYPWKSKIDESELHAFKYLIRDINASKGVIIVNSIIDSSLIDFAQKNYISICTLKDTNSKIWQDEITIPVIWIEVIPKVSFMFEVFYKENDRIHPDIYNALYSYDDGIITFTGLNYVANKWAMNEIPHETDSLHLYQLSTKNLKQRVNINDWREVKKLEFYYATDKNYYLRYFQPEEYKAIEDVITHEVSYTELEISIEKFKYQEINDWIKLDNADLSTSIPKGLNLLILTFDMKFCSSKSTSFINEVLAICIFPSISKPNIAKGTLSRILLYKLLKVDGRVFDNLNKAISLSKLRIRFFNSSFSASIAEGVPCLFFIFAVLL